MQINLSKIIEKSAAKAMTLQRSDGAMPQGHNGPYNDPETPVRNTAHFLFLLSDLFQKTGDRRYLPASEKAIAYLNSKSSAPFGYTFHCRNKTGKDNCNGLVGQAWVIEALVKAYEAFDREDCYIQAEKLFLLHPWNKNTALWKRVEIDSRILSYDGTFNHQLWFAAAGSLLKKTPTAMNQALTFINKTARYMHQYNNGVIFHASPMGRLINYLKNGPKELIREIRFRNFNKKRKHELYLKSVGYHGFNLYAYAILKTAFPEENFWKSKKFKKLINVCESVQFQKDLSISEFGYCYNLSGIEIAYAMETFLQSKEKTIMWIEKQLKKTLAKDGLSLSRGAPDINTAIARIYEASRLKYDYVLQIN